jgi:tRNA dimethylallyltransferase
MSLTAALAGAELLVVCGPTGGGKSALVHALGDMLPISVISADSRQVYRRFDIGTAKPSAGDRTAYHYQGIDSADPLERYSAARWAAEADGWIATALAAGRVPVVTGGTGLYLRALFEGLAGEPPLDPARRTGLQQVLARLSTAELARWVATLDPARAALGRTQLLRATEVALLSGRRISDLHRQAAPPAPRWRARYLVVDPGPALAGRIEGRLDAMLQAGWPDEVAALLRDVPDDAPAWNGTGYRRLRDAVRGTTTMAAARERILFDTRQYAKRQRTWFRHQLPPAQATRLDPLVPGAVDAARRLLDATRA